MRTPGHDGGRTHSVCTDHRPVPCAAAGHRRREERPLVQHGAQPGPLCRGSHHWLCRAATTRAQNSSWSLPTSPAARPGRRSPATKRSITSLSPHLTEHHSKPGRTIFRIRESSITASSSRTTILRCSFEIPMGSPSSWSHPEISSKDGRRSRRPGSGESLPRRTTARLSPGSYPETVSTNAWAAGEPTPFDALIVML